MPVLNRMIVLPLILALPGCAVKPIAPQTPSPPAQSTAASGIRGSVYSQHTQKPIVGMPVRLAEVVWDAERKNGNYVLDGSFSPSAVTGKEGKFLIKNAAPKEYVLFIGDPFGLSEVVLDETQKRARIYLLRNHQVLNAGKVYVNFPRK